jgi:hypothetical protein
MHYFIEKQTWKSEVGGRWSEVSQQPKQINESTLLLMG